jgi:hypothetical protein
MTVIEAARWYTQRGFWVIPIPFGEKGPKLKDWPALRLEAGDIDRYFNGAKQNIGVLLGAPWNLCDVDLDSHEALWTWSEFAPETAMVFGHKSKPASHFFYRTDGALKLRQYRDPTFGAGKDEKAMLLELRSFTEQGGVGLQTVVPPSVHKETGEAIEFVQGHSGEPANVEAHELLSAAQRAAACALLGRHAPGHGSRHSFFLALSGALAHAQWSMGEAKAAIRAIYHVLWGVSANLREAEKEVESTFQRYDDGRDVVGLPHLKELLDKRVFERAVEWLALGRTEREQDPGPAEPPTVAAATTPKPLVGLNTRELLAMTIKPPEILIQGMLPRAGATLLSGLQKSGKTLFAMQAAIAVATGRPLFEWFDVLRPGGVLILEQDDPAGDASVQQIYRASGVPPDAPLYFVGKQDQYLGPGLIASLRQFIVEKNIVLTVLDSYTALRPSHSKEVDIVKWEQMQMTLLDELGKQTDSLLLLLHHDSKGSTQLDWSSKMGGTFGMSMAVESQIQVARYPDLPVGSIERLVRLQGRHLDSLELCLRFERASLNYSFILLGSGAPLYPLVHEIWCEFGEQRFTVKDLIDRTGISRATAFRHLATLARADVIQKLNRDSERHYQMAADIARQLTPAARATANPVSIV